MPRSRIPSAGKVAILLGSGRGALAPAPVPSVQTGGTKPSAVAIADLNGDGRQDLVVANDGSNNVSVLLGDGGGGFSAAAKSPFLTGEARAVSATIGDFNGDAKTDVAVVNFSSGNVSVMLGDGLGGLARAPGSPTSTNGLHPGPAAAGDFNGDGKLDLAVANESGNVVVLKGDGTGRLSRAGASPFGLSPTGLGAGDFNADGKLDVAVANATGTVTILLGNGTGGLSLLPAAAPVNIVGTAPTSLAVADLDFDGRLDIAVANAGSGNVSVLRGDGGGRFGPAPGTPVSTGGTSPSALALGEMNGDGKLDLVAVNAGSASVAVLLNAVTPATFVSFPASPVVGEQITFAYSSVGCDRRARLGSRRQRHLRRRARPDGIEGVRRSRDLSHQPARHRPRRSRDDQHSDDRRRHSGRAPGRAGPGGLRAFVRRVDGAVPDRAHNGSHRGPGSADQGAGRARAGGGEGHRAMQRKGLPVQALAPHGRLQDARR